jgi:hydroxymethylpyrimidine pyrophosphatase-like HAD family hydrolase
MGKAEVNTPDPAFDIANTVLALDLSPQEENRLLQLYSERSGDTSVRQRLFLNKLLAGLWTMQSAREYLFGIPQPASLQREYHAIFLRAWDFLTIQAARFCGDQCMGTPQSKWSAPLVVLDVDGVIDRRTFGFPCTTAAGIEAISELRAQGMSVVLNTARSAHEVQHYCDAYSMAGGIAEHGAYLWNAVTAEGRVLIEDEAQHQLDKLRTYLRSLPGVFVDDRHHYSIRAFTYTNGHERSEGALASLLYPIAADGIFSPLPKLLMNHCANELGLNRLEFHQTTIDTTIVAGNHDKGTGLAALRDWVGLPYAETVAIGDSAPDLPMFRAATRSFAPAHIHCGREAKLLGCEIAHQPYQRGFLEIVLLLTGRQHRKESTMELAASSKERDIFLAALRAADKGRWHHLKRGLLTQASLAAFVR